MTTPTSPTLKPADPSEGADWRDEPTPAIEAWYAKHPNRSDRPRISVWYPTEAPFARLAVTGHGCQEPDTLPKGTLHAYLTLSHVEFGGPLEDLEMMVAAAAEWLTILRKQEAEMRAEGHVDE